jgi:hypothetical protein
VKDHILGPVAAMLERRGIRNRHGRNCSFGLQNAYQHFRKDAPRALYRSVNSCSNCHQISRTKPA